jgi:phosphoglucosamine mutase
MRKLFGTDGIRGTANTYPMDVETAVTVGRALARYLNPHAKARGTHILIGQDTRISGDMLAFAVASGLCSAGVDVQLLGVVPTPCAAYLTASTQAGAGIVISASHNPFDDNGIKLFDSSGFKLSDMAEIEIERRIAEEGATHSAAGDAAQVGRHLPIISNGIERYLNFLIQAVSGLSLKGMTLALDCANGAVYQAAPELFKRLGANVIPLFCDPDGLNINDRCGSQHTESLAAEVLRHRADAGLAFDGDGDRLIAVDENGSKLTGDQVMAICAQNLMDKGLLNPSLVVSTVMSNVGFKQALEKIGIDNVSTPVGDRYVMEAMLAEQAVLGGEDSGHIIFRDVHTTGDGLLAAVRLLEAIRATGRPLSQLAGIMTVFPQELINVDVRAKPELEAIPGLKTAIDEAQNKLGVNGRVLVRYSGTQNQCRVMVEGPDNETTLTLCRGIADVIQRAIGAGT